MESGMRVIHQLVDEPVHIIIGDDTIIVKDENNIIF
jgi:hypothetical protein